MVSNAYSTSEVTSLRSRFYGHLPKPWINVTCSMSALAAPIQIGIGKTSQLLVDGIDGVPTRRRERYEWETDASPSQSSPETSRPSPYSQREKCQPASGVSARSE